MIHIIARNERAARHLAQCVVAGNLPDVYRDGLASAEKSLANYPLSCRKHEIYSFERKDLV